MPLPSYRIIRHIISHIFQIYIIYGECFCTKILVFKIKCSHFPCNSVALHVVFLRTLTFSPLKQKLKSFLNSSEQCYIVRCFQHTEMMTNIYYICCIYCQRAFFEEKTKLRAVNELPYTAWIKMIAPYQNKKFIWYIFL